jgi:hypothetical protein
VFNDRPDQNEVYLEVSVHQHVSHADDLSPRHVGLLVACALGEFAGGFANDFQVSDHPDLDQLVVIERLSPAGCVSTNSIDSFEDVLNSVGI